MTAMNGRCLPTLLVEGEGSDHNGLFELDANGTLRSKTSFDYETNASEYTVRIRATDERNTSTEGAFIIYLLDEFEDLDDDGTEDHLDDDIDGDGFSNEVEIAYGSDPRRSRFAGQPCSDRSPFNRTSIGCRKPGYRHLYWRTQGIRS